ncbi:DUF1573 domain-containing protein [Sediminitomix flava]|uniref:Uncharacterized protein DUF1573 n=1 Tax=Sediminitomix flava TaxID=379075 RepID=A0A315Z9H9_SEDFL|nr:DUF1573 domain-containing protein [Sediminitomix flava]PWJ40854.1 uncharacterized protein DUF1573 [Sediminitomix flava]
MREKFNLLVFISLFGFSGSLLAQSSLVQFKETEFDFGRIPAGQEKLEHKFEFEVVQEGLQIDTITADCSCLGIYYSKEKLSKGTSSVITVAYIPYKAGGFEKSFKVKYKGQSASSELMLKGFIEPTNMSEKVQYPYEIGPLRFKSKKVRLGSVSDKGLLKKTVEFYNSQKDTLKFIKQPKTPKYIKVVLDETKLPPHSKSTMDIFLQPELVPELGAKEDSLHFYTNLEDGGEFVLPLSFNLTKYRSEDVGDKASSPKISVFNDEVDLGKIKVVDYYLVSIRVMNTGELPLVIEQVKAGRGCEVVSLEQKEIAPYSSININVKFWDQDQTGQQVRRITIVSNDPEAPEKVIEIKADLQ